jgi:hypothetical protein
MVDDVHLGKWLPEEIWAMLALPAWRIVAFIVLSISTTPCWTIPAPIAIRH